MFFGLPTLLLLLLLLTVTLVVAEDELSFSFNGFKSANLIRLDGTAEITPDGLLRLTNHSTQQKGHAFYSKPFTFKPYQNGTVPSFSTTFVFAIRSEYPTISGHGIAFVIFPKRGLPVSQPNQYLGLFNESTNGNAANHVFAVELDTIQSSDFDDINNNHVGIDINGLKSEKSEPAGYFADKPGGSLKNLTLISGQEMQVWVEYDAVKKQIDVTLAPINVGKPRKSLLSLPRDLSSTMESSMHVGFSSTTGSFLTSHYVLGWSFSINGIQAQELDLSQLPKLPPLQPKKRSKFFSIGLPLICLTLIALAVWAVVLVVKRKRKFAEVVEYWELEYGPQRYRYKDLYMATKGFKDKELLGSGGFGRVYKGVLPTSKSEIAVK